MFGAIIGDIVGSHYEVLEVEAIRNREDKKRPYEERIKILDPNTKLFTSNCSYTDDSILTLAIAYSLLNHLDYESSLRTFGLNEINLGQDQYGRSRFGKGFVSWLKGETKGESYGNGASMRISSIGYYYDDLDTILRETKNATIPSHNNEEAIIAAQATTTSIFLARTKHTKEQIKQYIKENFGYNLDYNLEELQRNYRFSSRSSESVPQAIYVFLESNSFEDCLRKSISIGGDTDTIAAISCSIAESFYGIPDSIKEQALSYLTQEYKNYLIKFYKLMGLKKSLYELNICSPEFWSYIHSNTKRINFPLNSGVWGTFTESKDRETPEIKILVPELQTELSYLINIHEYAHAFELFGLLKELKSIEDIDKKQSETFARAKEKEYLVKKKIYEQS